MSGGTGRQAVTRPVDFEPEFVAALKAMFEEKILFNQVLGLKITSLAADRASGRIGMR